MPNNIKEKLNTLPAKPGVYLFMDKNGKILYVGKAKVLRSRVRSYFQPGSQLDPSKQHMVQKVADINIITTDTENEALVLEANLIRKHQPPHNVVLRDDKYYLFIKITNEKKPRVFPVRRIQKDGARYFGPYSSARSVRATLRLLQRIFPFQGEKEKKHDMVFPHPLFENKEKNDSDRYKENIQNIIRFLQGKRNDIMQKLTQGMNEAAEEEHFERAAIFRNQLQAIERLEGFQKVYLPGKESFDVISIARDSTKSAANVFQIRGGKLLAKNTFLLQHKSSASPEETLRQFMLQYYKVAQDIPDIILTPQELYDAQSLSDWIRPDNPPTLLTPQRGKKRQLIAMGETNAQHLLDEQEASFQSKERLEKARTELAKALSMPENRLRRIETYDISNIQGTLATASMVVFIDGQAAPSMYRKFRLRSEATPNDFLMLQETLRRRFSGQHTNWPTPDLIIIDGGKGQLSATKKVLDELHLTTPIISIAKREEELFLPGKKEAVRLPHTSDALQLVQRMRDEAHRFTITYHRLLRSKKQRQSLLDEVPGIGPKTKKELLRHFGSLKAIRSAEESEVAKVIGKAKAKILREYL